MTTLMRNDIHRPSAINPEAYDFVGVMYIGDNDLDLIMANAMNRKSIEAHMARTGGHYSHHEHGGSCAVCGACALYLAVFHHRESNEYIHVGEDCAAKMDMGHAEAFNPLRRAIANAREAIAGKNKAKLILSEAGLTRAWDLFNMELPELVAVGAVIDLGPERETRYNNIRPYTILVDMVKKLIRYGSISDKAVEFLKKLVDDVDHASERAAERKAKADAERAAAEDCPSGRVVIDGEVLSTRIEEGDYGVSYKMLVKDNRGFKVWSTIPSTLLSVPYTAKVSASYEYSANRMVAKGDKVKFTATLEVAERDSKFGFAKRPSKASCSTANDAACIARFEYERTDRD